MSPTALPDAPGAQAPADREQAAALLADCSAAGHAVRLRGGGSKLSWGRTGAVPALELATSGLDRVVEHNEGDFTAVLEAGVPVAAAQERFAAVGQMLALDPPDGGATMGGLFATADSGPLRHRYGGPRDLIVGATVALSDGTLARSGGKVIKNVAGYDLAKLFTGAFGTLGLIVEVAVRLHPRPRGTVTVVAEADDAVAVAAAAALLAHSPLEMESLDVAWSAAGAGRVLARFGGLVAGEKAESALAVLHPHPVQARVQEDDDELWAVQRAGQRRPEGCVVRVSALPAQLAELMGLAQSLGGELVGRAALGVSWIALPALEPEQLEALRGRFAACVLLDGPPELRAALDPWGHEPSVLAERVRARFDPTTTCNAGLL